MVCLRNNCVLQSNMVSPFAVHQQQLAFMSQQQALLMAALKSGNAPQMISGNANLLNANGSNAPHGNLPTQSWPNLGYQIPGSTPAAQNGATKVKIHRWSVDLCTLDYQFYHLFIFLVGRLGTTIKNTPLGTSVLVHLGKLYCLDLSLHVACGSEDLQLHLARFANKI